LEKFEPFGDFNPKPKFLTKNLIVNETNPVGSSGQHLKIKVSDGGGLIKKVIIFNCESVCPNLQPNDQVDLVYEIMVNQWNGNKEIELNCLDLKKV
jgi:single-stranded-DNA-specific exonuclease